MAPTVRAAALAAVSILAACETKATSQGADASSPQGTADAAPIAPGTRQFRADAWADNWFALYAGDRLLKEDSVPITTERSFNAESFTFAATSPLVLSFVLKDYTEDDSGLEYIGKPNQQIGDGGFIFQLRDATSGGLSLVSNASWKCLVIHKAPLNAACEKDPNPAQTCISQISEEPPGWREAAFDDSSWPNATEFTAAAVGPEDGYNDIAWDPSARFIWSSDLKADNTVLCRVLVR